MTVTARRTIRILLADDHAVVRRGLRMVLETEPDMEVVGEADDGLEAVELAIRAEVDLAVLDVTMPRMSGLQAARELSQARALASHPDALDASTTSSISSKPCGPAPAGYVLKSVADHDLIRACRRRDARRAVHVPGLGAADARARSRARAATPASPSSPGASPRSWR